MQTFYAIWLALMVLFLIFGRDLVGLSVYGKFLKEEELDTYLTKTIGHYEINELSPQRMFTYRSQQLEVIRHPYIAERKAIFSKWYISDYGQISRWSKWGKLLDQKFTELESQGKGRQKKTQLSEL